MNLDWLWHNPVTRWWWHITRDPEPIGASAPWQLGWREWGRTLARSVRGANADDYGIVASSIAFAAFLSILPLLSLVALTYGALVPPDAVMANIAALTGILPDSSQSMVQGWLHNSLSRRNGHGLALILSALLTLFSARRVGRSVLGGITIASGIKQDRDPLSAQFVALATVTAGALLLFAALVSLSGLAILRNLMPDDMPAIADTLSLILWLALTLGPAVALLLLYRYAPARASIPWRWAMPGVIVAVALWIAATLAFREYVSSLARYDSIYGSLSAVVVLQLWLMLSAYILLLGAKVNAEAMRAAGVDRQEGGPD